MATQYSTTGRAAGEEGAITDQGRYLTFVESDLVHPYHADGFADKGDPVIIGNIVGVVCSDSPTAATDLVTVDTEGVWYLNVIGSVSDGTSDGIAKALIMGDPVSIQMTPSTDVYLLSGESDPSHFKPFGYLLSGVSAHVSTPTLAAVKVHNGPVAAGGRLHFGSGSTAAGNMLLEGDTTLRRSKMFEACLAPETILLAGEQIHGMEIRIVDNVISTGGEITAAEFKAVRDEATDASVSAATGVKVNVDNKNGAAAPYCRGVDIKCEGVPGTAPAIRSGIHIGSSGTAGTLEAVLELDADCFGCKTVTTNPSDSGTCMQIPIMFNGTMYYLLGYNATGS